MLNELFLLNPAFCYGVLGLFSLAIGSLLNVVIYRLPLMMQAEWRIQCQNLLSLTQEAPSNLNLFFPRSFCPQCRQIIPFWHNLPILSYCLLRGRCHVCRKSIPVRYPLVELLSLVFSLLTLWHFGLSVTAAFALLFIWTLIVIFFIDLEHQMIPDSLSLSLLWLGLIANTQSLFTSLPDAVLSAVAAYLSLWLLIKLFYLVTGKIGMGHGDFKLFAAFGAWFGWTELPFILFFSAVTGAMIGLIYLKTTHQSRETPIPFGPFLCMAALLSLFYGESIVLWYLGTLPNG